MMKMLKYILVIPLLWLFSSCSEDNLPQAEYSIYQIGMRPTIGNVTVRDLDEGKIEITIKLTPFIPGDYPTHLHFGSINTVGELAYRLNDMNGATGVSRTVLDNVQLSDGTLLTYDHLMDMDGSIKVHMADLKMKNAVVAYGNIGKNDNYLDAGIPICTGH